MEKKKEGGNGSAKRGKQIQHLCLRNDQKSKESGMEAETRRKKAA